MEITRDKATETLERANNKTHWAKLLGFNYLNGRVSNILSSLVSEYDLDCSHFKKKRWESKRKYKLINKSCPVCSSEFETQKNHPREKTVCSRSCSNVYFAKIRHTPEANAKTKESIRKYLETTDRYIKRYSDCVICKKQFVKIRESHKHCSKKCGSKNRVISEETREKLRQVQLKLIEEGRHSGWQSRDKCKRSYAENYITKILNKNGIIEDKHYEFEYRQNKWFIDFAFVDEKIAVEIDGKQHEYPKRKKKDAEKDAWLTKNGWKVHRIKWKRPSLETRRHLLKELNKVISFEIKDDTNETQTQKEI